MTSGPDGKARPPAGKNSGGRLFLFFCELCARWRANEVDWSAFCSAGVSSIATITPTTALIRLEAMLAAQPATAGTKAEPASIMPMILPPIYRVE